VVLVDDSVVVPGDEAVVVVVLLLLLDFDPLSGFGFTIVVLFSVFFSAGAVGATVSVFCSHATKRAAPARMQRYFFIVCMGGPWMGTQLNRTKGGVRPCSNANQSAAGNRLECRRVCHAMSIGHGL
jgi:hypothetical protein